MASAPHPNEVGPVRDDGNQNADPQREQRSATSEVDVRSIPAAERRPGNTKRKNKRAENSEEHEWVHQERVSELQATQCERGTGPTACQARNAEQSAKRADKRRQAFVRHHKNEHQARRKGHRKPPILATSLDSLKALRVVGGARESRRGYLELRHASGIRWRWKQSPGGTGQDNAQNHHAATT